LITTRNPTTTRTTFIAIADPFQGAKKTFTNLNRQRFIEELLVELLLGALT